MVRKVLNILATFFALLIFAGNEAAARFIDINVPELPRFSAAALITFLVRILIVAAFVIAFIFLLIGGIRWITSGGDPKGVESAKNTVTAAIIGLFLVVSAYAIIRLIEFFFNVPIISAPLVLPHI